MGWFSRKPRQSDPVDGIPMQPLDPAVRIKPPAVDDDAIPTFQNVGNEIGALAGRSPRARDRIRQAFSPSNPIQDTRLLAGRKPALTSLIRGIQDMNLHVVIYGERGVGKTSLLHVLKVLAQQARYQVAYHSCTDSESFSDVFRAVAAEIPLLYHDRFGPFSEETERGGTLADQLPQGPFSVSQFGDALSQLSKTRLLIMLDEFDRSASGTFRRNIAELIKNLSDRSVRVQLVIAGVAGNLSELIEHVPSIRRNLLSYRVPEMTVNEITQMIRIGERVGGLRFDKMAVDRIVTLANGSPYLASLIGQYACFDAYDHSHDTVRAEHIARAAKVAAGELRMRLAQPSVEAIDRMTADGLNPTILPLVHHAMHSMGVLDPELVQPLIAPISFTDLAAHLTRHYGLLEAESDESKCRYRFREDGIASYLWIRSVGENIELGGQIAQTHR